jgi:myo-inositol-1-phosphate synthase
VKTPEIAPAKGKLGILLVGLGAVSTTTIAGVLAIRKGLASPIGSLTQMGTVRLGKRTEGRSPKIKEIVPLAELDNVVFGGWDIFADNSYQAARTAGVLDASLLDQIKPELEAITPMSAVFDQRYVKRLDGPNVKKGKNKRDLAEQLRADIRGFKKQHGLDRLVMVWCGSTEVFLKETAAHQSIESFEKALEANDVSIPSSMVYAYAALMEDVPFANGAPNLTVDVPAIMSLAQQRKLPVCGKDFKTGQTWIKTVIAPGIKARLLGVEGWYSTNILGNRDGEVLDDPSRSRRRRRARSRCSTTSSSRTSIPVCTRPPPRRPDQLLSAARRQQRGLGQHRSGRLAWLQDAAEDQFPLPRQHLAAPIVLDLALFLDLAKRTGMSGIQEWLSFYFKSPMHAPGLYPEHDLFIQLMKLKNTLRHMVGEELITHLGLEYYD